MEWKIFLLILGCASAQQLIVPYGPELVCPPCRCVCPCYDVRGKLKQTLHNPRCKIDVARAAPAAAMTAGGQVKGHAPPTAPRPAPAVGNPFEAFNAKLYQALATTHPTQNFVYSPISLQTLLALVLTGAEGATARELQQALHLTNNAKVKPLFGHLLNTLQNARGVDLIMANKIYLNGHLTLNPYVREMAQMYFHADLERVNFANGRAAAQAINTWVASHTEQRIRDIIAGNALNAQTQAVLVNAIYFKGRWDTEFSKRQTAKQPFHTADGRVVQVDTMYNEENYRYGDFPDLKIQVIEMPYKGESNISMMIILPNDRHGLAGVERRMQSLSLSDLSGKLRYAEVNVRMPKFRVEFEQDMVGPLNALGVRSMFQPNSQITKFFEGSTPIGVSKVQHKAFLDVNEAGSEAAAASFVKLVPLSLPSRIIDFNMDHPFMFAIRHPQAVLFTGHVVTL